VSFITIVNSTTASGKDLAISQMIVSGDGLFDGTYSVTGTVGTGFGDLTFDTSLHSVTIVGGVTSLVPNGTTLLTGTGLFSNIVVTAPNCTIITSHLCPTVSFDATSTLDASLLSALGISGNAWNLSSFDTAEGTGNGFPQNSAEALNTQIVPEPATLLLLGSGLFSLGLMRWRKAA
jgi:PEP-CTERM motif